MKPPKGPYNDNPNPPAVNDNQKNRNDNELPATITPIPTPPSSSSAEKVVLPAGADVIPMKENIAFLQPGNFVTISCDFEDIYALEENTPDLILTKRGEISKRKKSNLEESDKSELLDILDRSSKSGFYFEIVEFEQKPTQSLVMLKGRTKECTFEFWVDSKNIENSFTRESLGFPSPSKE